MPEETIKPAYIPRRAAADYLSVSPRTISRLRASGVLPAHQISGVNGHRYAVADLEAIVQRDDAPTLRALADEPDLTFPAVVDEHPAGTFANIDRCTNSNCLCSDEVTR